MTPSPTSSCHSKVLSKGMEVREGHPCKGDGCISITGHRAGEAAIAFEHGAEIEALMPKLYQPDYFTEPRLQELAARERGEVGYCRRVNNFRVGRKGYGSLMFFGETDVRRLDLENTVQFGLCEVIVYGDENRKPPVGQGLNKPAEVTLLNVKCVDKMTGGLVCDGPELVRFEKRLKRKNTEQDADFISYDASKQEWKFRVKHFSRFGLDDSDDEEELAKDSSKALVKMGMVTVDDIEIVGQEDNTEKAPVWQPESSDVGSEEIEVEGSPMEGIQASTAQTALAHSLPAHLRLDPLKMQQMRMLFFPAGEEAEDIALPRLMDRGLVRPSKKIVSTVPAENNVLHRSPGYRRDCPAPAEDSPQRMTFSKHLMKASPQASWKRSPSYTPSNFGRHESLEMERGVSPAKHSRMLLSLESKEEHFVPKRSRIGFRNELCSESCISGRSGNVADAALFLGSSFRVGWGPHGLLAHCGNPVGEQDGLANGLSSLIRFEKVALDSTVRDEQGKARDDLIDLQFISPLNLHTSMSKVVDGMDEQPRNLRLRYLQCNRVELPSVCSKYEDLIVKQHASEGLSASQRLVLRHQVMVWHLLSVLFSDKFSTQGFQTENDEALENPDDMKVPPMNVEPEVKGLVRRAEFSSWLQDSVSNGIQDELMSLEAKDQLKEIFSLLTGRQLDDAVQIAAARGDVRLACLISQAGGSVITRKDIAWQLEIWTEEGLDYNLIEKDRVLLYKLLSGDVQGALADREIDWKRFLGLLMWYHLAPDTELPNIIKAYSQLVDVHAAPRPIPMYVEEGASNGISELNEQGFYDTAYYLMLLHANQGQNGVDVRKMFCSFSSTYDPLDHRMAWLQQGLLQAIGVLSPLQFHVLDMNFVSQLLSVGQCHWAIYVALHMPPNLDHPGLHEKVVKEILNQYCEVWSTRELQQSFLEEELGIPSEWLHEALGMYWQYSGDSHKALVHHLKSLQWHRSHSLFMTSVAASLYVNAQHEELLKLVTHLETHKAELDNWDLGGGIYAGFYVLKHSFQNDDMAEELDSFEKKASACRTFFQRLKESQSLWGRRSLPEIRVAYSRMADDLATLLLAESKAKTLYDEAAELKLYNTVMDAPVPEDIRLCRIQGAVSAFTSWLSETALR